MSTQPCGCHTTSKPRHYCEIHSFSSPESSNISAARFDVDSNKLTVTFHGTRTYMYPGVPPSVWDAFYGASSKGEYFQSCIKDTYAGVRVS